MGSNTEKKHETIYKAYTKIEKIGNWKRLRVTTFAIAKLEER